MLGRLLGIGCAIIVGVTSSYGSAGTVINAGWPPPGGAVATPSGAMENIGESVGFSWTYTGLDTTYYDGLWWGVSAEPQISMSGAVSPSESLAFDNVSGTTIIFSGNSSLTDARGTDHSLLTRLLISAVDANGNSLVPIVSPIGLNNAFGDYVFEVPGAAHDEEFSVTYYAEAYDQGEWLPINTVFDFYATQDGDEVTASVYSGFWYTEESANVPEPTTLAIWATLGGLGMIAARRRRKAA